MRFVAPTQTPKGLARRLPPAVFPAVMGLLGLGLGWRTAAQAMGAPAAVGEVILGATMLLFGVLAAGYAAKALHRPGVIIDELRLMPGRLGLSALVACLYLAAIALFPHAASVARPLILGSLALHLGLVLLIAWTFLAGPPEARRYSPAGHLYFVSPIVGAMALSVTGDRVLGTWLLAGSLALALTVWALGLLKGLRQRPAPALRPLAALHLAPAAVGGLTAQALGQDLLAQGLLGITVLVLAGLLVQARRLTEGGFTPLWSAFTFPPVACAGFWIGAGGPWQVAGGILLVASSFVIPAIAYRVLRLWLGGQLAVRTNAAVA